MEGEGAEDGEQGEQAAGRQHRPGVAGQQPHVPAVTLYYGSIHDKHHCHRIIIIVMYFFPVNNPFLRQCSAVRVRGHIELAEWRPSHAQWGEACPGYIQMGTTSTKAAIQPPAKFSQ